MISRSIITLMAPGIHPPCTPSASCQPPRCHPTLPPCAHPEQCLRKTVSKGIKPCASAVSIMATKSKEQCGSCGKFKCARGKNMARNTAEVQQYLKRKSREKKMRKKDRLQGTYEFLSYVRRQGSKREASDCCAGHGHRGRVQKGGGAGQRKCVIL